VTQRIRREQQERRDQDRLRRDTNPNVKDW